MRYVLADVNVWVATVAGAHRHHDAVTRWWRESVVASGDRVAFCRLTQLSFLRLLGNRHVMGADRKSAEEAWPIYERLLASGPVIFAPEPEGTDELLAEQRALGGAAGGFWADSYLAAFARAGSLRLATFDRDSSRFPQLDLVLL